MFCVNLYVYQINYGLHIEKSMNCLSEPEVVEPLDDLDLDVAGHLPDPHVGLHPVQLS